MDPVTHTLAGAALARGGRYREAPLALATAVVAANAPDVDMFAYVAGEYAGLAFRRGWSHGPLAWLVLPLVVVAGVLAYDRVRGRGTGERPAARPLLMLAVLGVLSHPALDWLNTYGIRLFSPFWERWFYGDAVFIIDPWIWVTLGGALFLGGARSLPTRGLWLGAGLLGIVLMLGAPMVPWAAKLLWAGATFGLVARRVRHGPAGAATSRALVRKGGVAVVVYVLVLALGSLLAERHVRSNLEARGIRPVEAVMVGPVPANPFRAEYVARTPGAYYRGDYHWISAPRIRPEPDSVPLVTPDSALRHAGRPVAPAADIVAAAQTAPRVRDFLVWSRFPYYQIVVFERGYGVRVGDARYARRPEAGSLAGVIVRMDDQLRLTGP